MQSKKKDLPDSMICFAKTLQKAKENLSEKDREEVIGFHTFQRDYGMTLANIISILRKVCLHRVVLHMK